MKSNDSRIAVEPFGEADGKKVFRYRLKNGGVELSITDFGATIVSLKTPDRHGKAEDIVLGYDDLRGYIADEFYLGGTIGRYANRIAGGAFVLNGKRYTLPLNNGPNHLHGGPNGFHKKVWECLESISGGNFLGVRFRYLSSHGEQGYPGNLSVNVTYALWRTGELVIEYEATTDEDTVLNLTNHSYFNLAGAGNGDILSHVLQLRSSAFTPVNKTLIPTGEMRAVTGTPFDFTTASEIGARINADNEQLKLGRGYDHNFVLEQENETLTLAARVYEPKTGRSLDLYTTEPGLQFYSGNFLDGTAVGKEAIRYGFRSGFCLETQHFPDSPNQPAFPSTVLRAGGTFRSRTAYRFSAQ